MHRRCWLTEVTESMIEMSKRSVRTTWPTGISKKAVAVFPVALVPGYSSVAASMHDRKLPCMLNGAHLQVDT